MLPFNADQFFAVFRVYNEAVWPAQVILAGLALAALWLVARPNRWSNQGVAAILGLFWLWLGLVYHLAFFTTINPMAFAFATFSTLGGLVFLWFGVVRRKLRFRLAMDVWGLSGLALVVFGLLVYPALSVLAGHRYPAFPTFGLPCPTTIFTVGMLAFLVPPYPWLPLVAPVLWCLVGAWAAFLLGVPQDAALLLAAAVGVCLFRRSRAAGPPAVGAE
ncbi:DUF6064 family protein [Arenimonas aestuarii]